MITRKNFVKTGVAAGGVLLAGEILSLNNIFVNLFADERRDSSIQLSEKAVRILINSSHAPSGHNTQPWMVKIVSESEWIIGWDKSRSLPAVDPENRELLLSIGAFCEGIKIAAKNEGLESRIEVTGRTNFSSDLVKIRFSESERSCGMIDALQKRRTIKNGHQPRAIENGDLKYITSGLGSGIYSFNKGSREASLIEAAVLESNKIQAWRDDAQGELGEWLRWSDSDVQKYRNGLSPAGMEITGFGGWYVKHFFSREDVMSSSFRDQTVGIIQKFLSSYGSWIIITSTKDDCQSLIHAGGDFLKLSLNSVNKKIAIHPMTQPLEEKGFADNLRRELGIKEKIQFILRTGYVEEYPLPVSERMPVERIVI